MFELISKLTGLDYRGGVVHTVSDRYSGGGGAGDLFQGWYLRRGIRIVIFAVLLFAVSLHCSQACQWSCLLRSNLRPWVGELVSYQNQLIIRCYIIRRIQWKPSHRVGPGECCCKATFANAYLKRSPADASYDRTHFLIPRTQPINEDSAAESLSTIIQ